MAERLPKLTKEEKHAYLELITSTYFEGCECEVVYVYKTAYLKIKLGMVEDLVPMPTSIEQFHRYLHTFERFANKWNARGVEITTESWTKKCRGKKCP